MSNPAEIATAMASAGCSAEQVAAVLSALQTKSSGAARQARYRERQASQVTVSDVTIVTAVTGDASVTTLPLSAPPRDINSTPSPNPIAKNTRGSRLPDDWLPSQAGGLFAAEALGGIERSSAELLKFRDYWRAKPGAAGVKLDWEATWRNWVRSAAERGPRGGPPPKTDQRFQAFIDLQQEANSDRSELELDPERLYLKFSGDQART